MPEFEFSKVVPTDEQIGQLYDLLGKREHGISHKQKPSLEDHSAFVKANPYRAWYIVTKDGASVGSFYISNENTIGINLVCEPTTEIVRKILNFAKANYNPLPAVASVRADFFAVNVSPTNTALIETLEKLGSNLLQVTYSID